MDHTATCSPVQDKCQSIQVDLMIKQWQDLLQYLGLVNAFIKRQQLCNAVIVIKLQGIVNQGVPNQNHVSNGIMMSDKTGDNMHMMQQQPNIAMMGSMDKSNLGMPQMRSSMSMVQPGNVQRQVTDMGGGIMTQDNTQQQQQPIQVNANMLNSMNQVQFTKILSELL